LPIKEIQEQEARRQGGHPQQAPLNVLNAWGFNGVAPAPTLEDGEELEGGEPEGAEPEMFWDMPEETVCSSISFQCYHELTLH